jgi:hypothetical protein
MVTALTMRTGREDATLGEEACCDVLADTACPSEARAVLKQKSATLLAWDLAFLMRTHA